MHDWQQDLSERRRRFALPPLTAQVVSFRGVRDAGRITATAGVAVTNTVDGEPLARVTRPFTFTLVAEDGWKICSATAAD